MYTHVYMCIHICQDYILKNALDHITELGFTLIQKISRRYPATYIPEIYILEGLQW